MGKDESSQSHANFMNGFTIGCRRHVSGAGTRARTGTEASSKTVLFGTPSWTRLLTYRGLRESSEASSPVIPWLSETATGFYGDSKGLGCLAAT
jgi:hypothetical protein